jgi:NhaA family Na+:H+ antiporter
MRHRWREALPYYPSLPLGALVAIVWANSAGDSYFRVAHALAFPVNEIGVAFGLAALAQQVLEAVEPGGTVRSWRDTRAAVGMGIGGAAGAAITYAVYIGFSDERVLMQGWPIACGVDIFVAVAVARSIFRDRAAVRTVVILAIVGDVLALLVISQRPFVGVTNPAAASLIPLAVAMSLVYRRVGIRSMWVYLLAAGPVAWVGCYEAGIHPALALLPIVPFFPKAPRALDDFTTHRHEHASVTHFESVFAYPLQVVALLFGLVNAGVLWRGYGTATWAILAASLVGRPTGIMLTAAAAGVWRRNGTLPGVRPPELVIVALITSVGSVFALFLSTAVFPAGPSLSQVKLGALATVAGIPLVHIAARHLRVGRFAGGGYASEHLSASRYDTIVQ